MIRASESLDDLTSDIRHLQTLIGIITNLAIDIDDPSKRQNEISDLLWIARDMVEQLAENGDACHHKVLADKNAERMTGGQRNG